MGEGWRLPTKEEWLGLTQEYGGSFDVKKNKTSRRKRKAYEALITGGESGFNAKFGGTRNADPVSFQLLRTFNQIHEKGYYWSGTERDGLNSIWCLQLDTDATMYGGAIREWSLSRQFAAASVRCIK